MLPTLVFDRRQRMDEGGRYWVPLLACFFIYTTFSSFSSLFTLRHTDWTSKNYSSLSLEKEYAQRQKKWASEETAAFASHRDMISEHHICWWLVGDLLPNVVFSQSAKLTTIHQLSLIHYTQKQRERDRVLTAASTITVRVVNGYHRRKRSVTTF